MQVQPFTMNVGPTFPLEEEPVAIFSTLFTPQLVDHIAVETNCFATLCLTKVKVHPLHGKQMLKKSAHIWALPY